MEKYNEFSQCYPAFPHWFIHLPPPPSGFVFVGSTSKPPFLLQNFSIISALPCSPLWVSIPPVLHRRFSFQPGVQGPGELRPGHTSCILHPLLLSELGVPSGLAQGSVWPSGICNWVGKGVGNTSPASQHLCCCLFIPFVGDLATSF